MRILFTGASSFTGYWFVQQLAAQGHQLVMPMRRTLEAYEGVRRERVLRAGRCGEAVFQCAFGDERFLDLISASSRWDVLCHHAADVTDYRSPDFDISAALHNNTNNLRRVLEAMTGRGCRRIVLTGSVFEPGEGAGSEGLPAFSPYGVSKALTAQVVEYYAQVAGMRLGKFVIPNPFGPYEEPRFTQYLLRTWFEGGTASVRTPDYVRDNIHVSLLARAYARFVASLPESPGRDRLNPSGYIESQGTFAERVAREMRLRLGLTCELELGKQTEFDEPRIRVNTDPLDADALGWDEAAAWEELASYYTGVLGTDAARK